ncbi:GIY-YIG nuclease family protein [Variovorax sp.]|jgi:predicted GIY-YIG superfamily endonuclease|uniref:GIY-YIG nuclease family protein n=1 Tax=Variovorax sp. TaxID=1871043 RepID=UPI0037D9FE8A
MQTRFDRQTWITLYVLELEHGCYYVGQSIDPEKRIKAHFDGEGSAWTRAHRPVAVQSRRPAQSRNWKDAEEIENQLTLMMMRTHGWQRVRGGYWASVAEDATRKNLIHHGQHSALAVNKPLDVVEQILPAAPQVQLAQPPMAVGRSVALARTHQPWSPEEAARLLSAFDDGRSIEEIATQHARTPGAILARLVRLGRIESRRRGLT